MKEVCGFEGKNGRFYKTKEECEKADLQYEVRAISSKLDNFSEVLEYELFRTMASFERIKYFNKYKDYYLGLVAKYVLRDSDKFIEIINQKKELEKKLDLLESKTNNKPWWLRVKWWK